MVDGAGIDTPGARAERLNRGCFCASLDRGALARALDAAPGEPALSRWVEDHNPHAFADQPVFVAPQHLERMAQVVAAVESVVALPAWRERALSRAPAAARQGLAGPRGVFFGYDFHLDGGRLGLIEINTNAGGAMLNAVLARAQLACCAAIEPILPGPGAGAAFEQRIVEMFRNEWRLAGRGRPLASIAIVDEAPLQQYLYAEFVLFRQLFERHGLRVVIAAPEDLTWHGGRLWHGGLAIDLVYNRLTDFYLVKPESAALRDADAAQAVVLTPDPRAHALFADKRHLALLSDSAFLRQLGVPEATQEVLLAHVPRTEVVRAADAERLWAARRGLFFKPAAGFGSRAAYRGDKITRRVWQEIVAGDYVAQAFAPPGERRLAAADADADGAALKFDLRAYAYEGAVQWVAARMYQGQTTNFRTPGGGFAAVCRAPDSALSGMH